MSFTDELQRLADLHASGALNADEFAAAKHRLLSGPSEAIPDLAPITDQLAKLRVGQELAALNRQWEFTRKTFLVASRSGKHGPYTYHVPTKGMAETTRIVGTIIGAVWGTISGIFVSDFPYEVFGPIPYILPLFGVVIVIIAWTMAAKIARNAVDYSRAEAEHRARCAALVNRSPGHEESAVEPNGLPVIDTHDD